jgi:hypothetical protein
MANSPYDERLDLFTLMPMQPFSERSNNPEIQPNTNVDANVRMTVQEAAAALGITVEAVRGRMHRGKYGREKTEDGRVFVIINRDQLLTGRERSETSESNGQSPPCVQSQENLSERSVTVRGQSLERAELVEELRDYVAFLKAELEARNEEIRRREEEHREEARRKDTIIAQLTQRIPELEAAPEPREAPETASEHMDEENVPKEPQEPAQRRSWLSKFFFGP